MFLKHIEKKSRKPLYKRDFYLLIACDEFVVAGKTHFGAVFHEPGGTIQIEPVGAAHVGYVHTIAQKQKQYELYIVIETHDVVALNLTFLSSIE